MSAQEGRKTKIEEQIKEIAARVIERESNKTALITVTRVSLEARGKDATVFISVLPASGEASALNFIKRKRPDIKEAIKKGLRLGTIPFIDVEIDTGEKARQNIDALLWEAEE